MATAKVTYLNGKTAIIPLKEVKNDNIVKMTIAEKLDYSKINYIDFDAERSCAETGDEGYFIALHTGNNDYIDNDICGDGLLDTGLMFFRKRTDMLFVNHRPKMYLYGVKKKDTCFIGIATGLTFQTDFVFEVKNGFYYNYARFLIEGEEPYEEPTIELHLLDGDNADFNGMAREYRKYQLSNGCVAIKDRLNEHLKYSAESMYIRIRNAWKTVPTPVLEQTIENEPEITVACDFKRTIDIMRAYKAAGIDKAEFCLVGWNKKGHDGRWPQILPVEETLGGEEGLREVIKVAEELGYKMTCHTNSTDA